MKAMHRTSKYEVRSKKNENQKWMEAVEQLSMIQSRRLAVKISPQRCFIPDNLRLLPPQELFFFPLFRLFALSMI